MVFQKALKLMKNGEKVKLPSWSGYWCWDIDNETIVMHTKDGEILDIRETTRVQYTLENILKDDWMIATPENCELLGGVATFGFDDAIKYLKRGLKVKRRGWNGKDQYIEMAANIAYEDFTGTIHIADHEDIGSAAIVFAGTRGTQIGWLASQSDMLAEDWMFVE